MKKIIVLTMLVLLAIGMPVVAVDFGGDFTIKAGSNFKEGYADSFDLSLDVSQAVDDYNTVSFELELDHAELLVLTGAAIVGTVDNPKLVTDVGAALGLNDFGVGAVVSSGIFESYSQEYMCFTHYEIEDIYVSAALHGGAEVVLTFADLVNVEMASDFDGAAKNWLVGSYGTVGPVSAELFYACEGDALADGQLLVDAVYSGDVGPAALTAGGLFWYDLGGDEDAGTREYQYSGAVAASADVGVTLAADVAVVGTSQEDHILEAVAIGLGVDPLEDLGVDVGIYLNTWTDAPAMLDHIDFSVWKDFGAANYRAGYLYSAKAPDNGTASLSAPFDGSVIDGGGFYINVDINY